VGVHGAWRNPLPRYRERMECFHISLDAQAVGTMVFPSVAPGVSSISTGSPLKTSQWSSRKVTLLSAAVELSFRPFLTYGATCTKPCNG